jgi:hypothetical protein
MPVPNPVIPSRSGVKALAWRSGFVHSGLDGLAVGFVSLPSLLFLLTWVNAWIAWPLAAALIFAMDRALLKATTGGERRMSPGPRAGVVIGIVAIVWTAFGGAGHLGYANADWELRDALYGDLIRYSWPIAYQLPDGSTGVLRTAMGYFLPAAFIAKVAGTPYADALLFIWTAIGVGLFLALLPVPRSRGALGWLVPMLIVIVFAGMDAVATWIYDGQRPLVFPEHLEWWTIRFQYSAFSTQLLWVPNHAIAAWIAAALLLRHRGEARSLDLLVLVLALLPLWSPFAALGFAPFIALVMFQWIPRTGWPRLSPVNLVVCAALVVIVGSLIITGTSSMPVRTSLLIGRLENAIPELLAVYTLFVMTEFGVILVAVWLLAEKDRDLLVMAGVILLVLPFVRFGPGNDIVMRSSIPSQAILCLFTVLAATRSIAPRAAAGPGLLLATCLAFGSITAIFELGRSVVWQHWAADYQSSMRQRTNGALPPHYVGRMDGRLLPWLLRPAEVLH